jgi:hypothetical protein
MARDQCIYCDLPSEVRAALDNARAQGETLRELARKSKISRASLGRHFQRCVPRTRIIEHGSSQGDIESGRTRVLLAQPHVTLSQVNGLPMMNVDTSKLVYSKNPHFPHSREPLTDEESKHLVLRKEIESLLIVQVDYDPPVDFATVRAAAQAKADAEAREAAEQAEAEAALKIG